MHITHGYLVNEVSKHKHVLYCVFDTYVQVQKKEKILGIKNKTYRLCTYILHP